MGLKIAAWIVNQLARLGEAAIMRFPIETDEERNVH